MSIDASAPRSGEPFPDAASTERGGGPERTVLLCLPAAKVSEPRIACYQQMPRTRLLLVGDEARPPAANLIRLRAWRLPVFGARDRWTASLSWLRDLQGVDPGPVDCIMSMELYSPATLQARTLARRLGVPHVVTIADVLPRTPFYSTPPWRQITRTISRSADAFLCGVELARESAIARGCPPERCSVISPGVDLDRFSPPADGLTSDPVAIFVGELRPDKGIRDVIAATDLARKTIPGLRLIVAGDGALRDEVLGHARTKDYVEYLGKIPRDALTAIYRSARCFVLAPESRRFWVEQFGFASVEAMACGLPVVITDCGAVRDVVPDWNPICPQRDVGALAAGIVRALGSVGEEWGARNREHVGRLYDSAQEAARIRDWLDALIVARS